MLLVCTTRRLSFSAVYVMSLTCPADKDKAYARTVTALGLGKYATTPNQHILGTVMAGYFTSADHHAWQQQVWYTARAVDMVVFAPFAILFAFGCTAVQALQPRTVGLTVVFVFTGVAAIVYAARVTATNGSRVTGAAFKALTLGTACLLIFNIAVVFPYPGSFSSFSSAASFLTLNFICVVPIILANTAVTVPVIETVKSTELGGRVDAPAPADGAAVSRNSSRWFSGSATERHHVDVLRGTHALAVPSHDNLVT